MRQAVLRLRLPVGCQPPRARQLIAGRLGLRPQPGQLLPLLVNLLQQLVATGLEAGHLRATLEGMQASECAAPRACSTRLRVQGGGGANE